MQERLINRLAWGGLAALAGGFVAISPLWLAALVAACLGLVTIASVTPLIALHATLALAPLRSLLSRAGSWPLPLDIGQTAFAMLMLAIWLAHGIRQKRLHLPAHWRRTLAPLVLFVFALLLHGLAAGATATWLREWLKWLALLLTALLTLGLCVRYGWAGVLSAILLAAAANAILGVLQFAGFVESAAHLQIDARFTRAYGSYEQPNPFAGLMGMTAPLAALAALGYATRARQRRRDLLPWQNGSQWSAAAACAACAILLVAALFMSWSRGAWLGGICATIAAIAAIPRRGWVSLLALSLSIALLAGVWLTGALPNSLDARLRNAVLELISLRDVRGVDFDAANYALVERVAHWQAALRMTEKPGPGSVSAWAVMRPLTRNIAWRIGRNPWATRTISTSICWRKRAYSGSRHIWCYASCCSGGVGARAPIQTRWHVAWRSAFLPPGSIFVSIASAIICM